MSLLRNDFGFLTMATPNDYLKAIGLALSLRVSNPGIPIAIACSNKVRPLVEPYFDYVVEERAGLKGFVHKVYLDDYTPFKETVFFDSDILVFKPVLPYVKSWGGFSYCACGVYYSNGYSTFGLDRGKILKKIGKSEMVEIGGAGHAYFVKPDSADVFDMAREITANFKEYVGDIPYADEDVMNIVMTRLDIKPAPRDGFLARYLSAKFGTMQLDACIGLCRFKEAVTSEMVEPCIMHFAANEAPVNYTWQLYRLFKKFGVPTKGLLAICISDFYERYIKLPISNYKHKFF